MKLFLVILLRRSVEYSDLQDKFKGSGDDDLVWLDKNSEVVFQSIPRRVDIGLLL